MWGVGVGGRRKPGPESFRNDRRKAISIFLLFFYYHFHYLVARSRLAAAIFQCRWGSKVLGTQREVPAGKRNRAGGSALPRNRLYL
jgi:hypothetical protein